MLLKIGKYRLELLSVNLIHFGSAISGSFLVLGDDDAGLGHQNTFLKRQSSQNSTTLSDAHWHSAGVDCDRECSSAVLNMCTYTLQRQSIWGFIVPIMLHSELLRHEENVFVHFLYFGADHAGSTWTSTKGLFGHHMPAHLSWLLLQSIPRKLILVSCAQSLIFLEEGMNVAHRQHFSWLDVTSSHIFFFLHLMRKHSLINNGNLT